MTETIAILVLDQDDPLTAKRVTEAIDEYQSVVIPCSSPKAILFTIQHKAVDVVILNHQQPFEKAIRLHAAIKATTTHGEVSVDSRFDDDTLWIRMQLIQRGAYEFLPK